LWHDIRTIQDRSKRFGFVSKLKIMESNYTGSEYANILAEVNTGKNVKIHFAAVNNMINGLNHSIDDKMKSNEDCNWLIGVCYNYYRLQQLIRAKWMNK
jgi:hypothetical protein